jgi:phosphoenolpyruvate phosphomutase
MPLSEGSTTLRRRLRGDRLVKLCGAHNALGARLAERAGFDGVWLSGLELSASYCVPDASIVTMTQALAAADAMRHAVDVPVVVDCDTGYGNAANVAHAVRRFEAVGAAAVCIEDKLFPKSNSFAEGPQDLASIAEFTGKIEAAKRAQAGADFAVIARVEALIAGSGMDDAVARAEAYADAGADAILIHSRARTDAEISTFVDRWDFRAPLVVVPTSYYRVSADQLAARGVKVVIYANQGLRSAVRAMEETFAEILRNGSTASIEPRITTLTELFALQAAPGTGPAPASRRPEAVRAPLAIRGR